MPAEQATNMLLAFKARGMADGAAAAAAAEGIARTAATQLLAPLLAAVCARVAVVLRQTFVVALERASVAQGGACCTRCEPQPQLQYSAIFLKHYKGQKKFL